MKRAVLVSLVLGATVAGHVTSTAQSRPDFSGSWTAESVPEPPAPPPPPPPPRSATQPAGQLPPPPPPPPPSTLAMAIRQTGTELVIERTLSSPDAAVIPRVTYKLDGGESINTNAFMTTKTTAAWEGSTLILSTVHSVEGKAVGSSREAYRLDGARLIVERTLNTPRGTLSGMQAFVRGG